MKMHFPSTYSLVNWTFEGMGGGGGGGKGVRQWTLVRGIFGQKQTNAFS